MLSLKQMEIIFRESVLGLPPSIEGEEADAARAKIDQEVAEMQESGIAPSVPSEWPGEE